MGILWVRGNFDEKRQRHAQQRGLVFKEVQGGEEVSVRGRRADGFTRRRSCGGGGWGEKGQMDGGE